MSKVFEALQRQLENENQTTEHRDPLASQVGTPDIPAGAGAESDTAALPVSNEAIGAPAGPRSNEGAVIPSFKSPSEGQDESGASFQETPHTQPANGKIDGDTPAPPQWRRPIPARIPLEVHTTELTQARVHPRLVLLTDPYTPECEQFRTLRTELFHAAESRRTQIVTVTSAVADEGKTSTLLNLALAIAQSKERRVLVIEGDLRRPSFSAYLALHPSTGINDVLNEGKDVFLSMFRIEEPGLYVLPVTEEAKNPTEMLSSERLGEMLERLRHYFDFILLDSPPVMPFADSRLLANHSDALILVVRAGVAPYETVEKAIEALPRDRIMGIVLNGAEHLREAGYYDYYYYYARRQDEPRSIHQRITNRLKKKKSRRRN
ncbi:MAG: CpsD/CapB family tyrosine-protein kinase [Blastocatellia bacterium]|nr:CpsD/CapB family tyrosine-protein kinase [Blastocatellia bacterium]